MSDTTTNILNTVNGVPVATATGSAANTKTAGGAVDKDAFLQLLVKQMEYQDPLDPQDNSAYVAQLAQFSALEQMTNVSEAATTMNSTLTSMNTSQLVSQMSSMIGQTVQWVDDKKVTHSGKVLGVSISDNAPSFVTQTAESKKPVSVPVSELTLVGSNAVANAATSSETKA